MKTLRMFLFIMMGLVLVYFAWHPASGQPIGLPVELWRSGLMVDADGHLLTVILPGSAPGPINRVAIGTTRPAATLDVVGTTRTSVIEITGGGDLAEPFDIAAKELVKPGMAVAIDPPHPGRLRLSDQAYDRTVAGIVSGANGLTPGLTMAQKELTVGQFLPVALTGRVYSWADASNGPIQPGDLLTTSHTPGHTMKVTDHAKAQGAIIGKALPPLTEGTGLILVLVSLQ